MKLGNNVDIEEIGGLKPLTKEEEQRISEYLKQARSKENGKKREARGISQKVD